MRLQTSDLEAQTDTVTRVIHLHSVSMVAKARTPGSMVEKRMASPCHGCNPW